MNIVSTLQNGGVGVLATDTLYGLVGRALDPQAVARIYDLKGRDSDKPMIILIASLEELALFDVQPDDEARKTLDENWPGPVSIILPCPSERMNYLHRGSHSLAFRMPDKPELSELLEKTGPLVAPSANPQGQSPAETIAQAKQYFGDKADFYQSGTVAGTPSKIIRLDAGAIETIRDRV